MSRKPTCEICSGSEFVESLVWCDGCSKRYHVFCLDPPLVTLTGRRWICPPCTRKELPSRRRRKMANGTAAAAPAASGERGGIRNKPPAANGVHHPAALPPRRGRTPRTRQVSLSSSHESENGESSAVPTPEGAGRSGAYASAPPGGGGDADVEEAAGDSSDIGSTITLFCRRDFRRYLRWKFKELDSQDNERRREEHTRTRTTFASIMAANATAELS